MPIYIYIFCYRGGISRNVPSEDQLWSYAVQLAAAIRAAHEHGLALR